MNQKLDADLKTLMWKAILEDPNEFTPSHASSVKTSGKELEKYFQESRLLTVRKKGKSRALYLSANDETWRWVEEHLGSDGNENNATARHFLHTLRKKLSQYMSGHGIHLAELFAQPSLQPQVEVCELNQQVQAAYLAVSSGQFDVRVRLRDLRSRLPDMSRREQDEILLQMQREGWLGLMANDDPLDRNQDDEAAALILGDRHRDLVFLHSEQRHD